MASRRLLTGAGIAGAGGVVYYLYSAGGSPKVAEAKFEHDAARVSAKLKGELPGKEKEYKEAGKEYGREAGQAIDRVAQDAKREAEMFDAKIQAASKDASQKLDEYRKEANKKVDAFDATVTQKAAETKGWFSGWFGSK